MAVIVPTVEEIVTRFPAFDGQEELLEACLAEAVTQVDDRWVESDTKIAIMYLTAHLAQTEIDRGADSGGAGAGGIIASESMGPMSVSYATPGASGGMFAGNDYATTIYGQRFAEKLRDNFGGVRVADAQ